MEISPRELRDVEIAEAFRGYNRDIVNDLLERAAAAVEAANERVREINDRLSNAQTEAGRTRETEDILHRTLLLAQRAADEAVAEAQQKARQMVEEAELQSRKMLAESEGEARRRGEAERRRLEEEILDYAARRDALLTDVEALTRYEADYRERQSRALEADLAALRTRPSSAPGPRPEVHDVDLPVASDAPASAEAMVDESLVVESSTRKVDIDALLEQQLPEPTPATKPFTTSPPASTPEATPAPAFSAGAEPARENPVELLGSDDAAEAEVLDDDAFFATLREAVHDDTPLGPRDDDNGRLNFFEDDEDRSSFRDVFRRRR
ncbi:MAG: DivIVA domain-containing protein [Actinomycetota bacterium]